MAKVQPESIIGEKFGYLTILEYAGKGKNSLIRVIAECVCGSIKEYFLGNLKRKNHTTSCGCHKKAIAGDSVRTHGLSGRNHLYGIWTAIKRRCYNKKAKDYPRYGGKGVRMCEEWKDDYKAFYIWAMANGWAKGMQVDKDQKAKELKMPALLYSPETCTVVSCKENQNSRSDNIVVEYKGETKTLSQIAEKYGVKYHMLWSRYITLKWDLDRAINTPARVVSSNK